MAAPSENPVPDAVLAAALARSSEGMIVTDAAQDIVFANPAVQVITGYAESEMLGLNCRFLQGHETDQAMVDQMRARLAAGETFRGTIFNYRKDGTGFWNDVTITPITDARGTVTHFVSVQRDASEVVDLREDLRVQLERTRREAETARLHLRVARLLSNYSNVDDVTDSIADAIRDVCGTDRSAVMLWDESTGSLRVNALSGWPAGLADRLEGFSVRAAESPALAALLLSNQPMIVGSNGSLPMQASFRQFGVDACVMMPVSSRGEVRGVLLGCWVVEPPSIALEPLEERLEGLSYLAAVAMENASLLDQALWNGTHDTLTGLPDRTLFEQALHRELTLSATTSEGVAVLYLDVDRFKRTNDTLGHHAGDDVLRYVASTLLGAVREADFVGRVGGDEFVIVISHVLCRSTAEQAAARIRRELETSPLMIGGQEVFVSISIGIAVSDAIDAGQPVRTQAELLTAAADAAMYRDKSERSGSADRASPPRELSIDSAIRGAVARGEVTAYFQPQLDLRTGTITGVEVLARWQHPQLGEISPAEFIPIAERNGVIHEIGTEMLRQALVLGTAALSAGTPVNVAVNVSVIQLMQQDFLDTVVAVLGGSSLPGERLIIEMTESLLVKDVRQIIARLQDLRDLGMGVSLDDFGTGNTSLMQLYDLPITELKIDRSFVQKSGPTGEALIKGIVELAHSIEVAVVTEGVETAEQFTTVRRLGSDRVQGFHVGRPLSHDDVLARLSGSPAVG